MSHEITSLSELEAHYGAANPNALRKETAHLTAEYRCLLEESPFCALATSGPDGLDCSPRGEPRGAVRVVDATTLAFADRHG